VAEVLLPVKTQLAPLKLLVTTLLVKLAEPDGVMVPGDMSSTVAVHTVVWPIATVAGIHATEVVVGKLDPHDNDTPVISAAATLVMTLRLAVLKPGPDGVHVT